MIPRWDELGPRIIGTRWIGDRGWTLTLSEVLLGLEALPTSPSLHHGLARTGPGIEICSLAWHSGDCGNWMQTPPNSDIKLSKLLLHNSRTLRKPKTSRWIKRWEVWCAWGVNIMRAAPSAVKRGEGVELCGSGHVGLRTCERGPAAVPAKCTPCTFYFTQLLIYLQNSAAAPSSAS